MTEVLYRGYLETKNKQCKEKFKGRTKFKTLGEVQPLCEYAGVLAEDVILIDVDDLEQSEILMKMIEDQQLNCRVYVTSRGRHFLFKNAGVQKCYTHVNLACGIVADIKVGSKNSYEVLKFDNEERFIEWDIDEGEVYQELPKWMLPIPSKLDFFNLEEGEGRNSTLFGYILTLTRYGFSKEESKSCLKLINKYVFKSSLSEEEIDTITRDEAFPEDTFTVGKNFQYNLFGDYLINNYHIKRVNGLLCIFQDGVYISGYAEIEKAMLKCIPSLRERQRKEVLSYINLQAIEVEENFDIVPFCNGLYSISQNRLLPYSPDIVVTNKIPWNYNENAYNELADNVLNRLSCNDEEIRLLLEECIGYCFTKKLELGKAFILVGERANGKSTFLNMIRNVIGKENYSVLDLEEVDDRFSTAMLAGKLANIGDDISDDFLKGKNVAVFKKLVTGNEIKAEFKGRDAFYFKPYATMLFSVNNIPRMKDPTGAVMRRLVLIPFNATFTKDTGDYDPYITYKLQSADVVEYLIKIGIEGLSRVIKNDCFTESKQVSKELHEYELYNNPVIGFVDEMGGRDYLLRMSINEIYHAYSVYCNENGFLPDSKTMFGKRIKYHFELESRSIRIDGKVNRMYCEKV